MLLCLIDEWVQQLEMLKTFSCYVARNEWASGKQINQTCTKADQDRGPHHAEKINCRGLEHTHTERHERRKKKDETHDACSVFSIVPEFISSESLCKFDKCNHTEMNTGHTHTHTCKTIYKI